MSDKIYGIDLGTTNSCLAVMESAGPRVIEIDGQPIVPSVVSFDRPKGEILVGQRARNRMVLEPESTVRSIKRHMLGKNRMPKPPAFTGIRGGVDITDHTDQPVLVMRPAQRT